MRSSMLSICLVGTMLASSPLLAQGPNRAATIIPAPKPRTGKQLIHGVLQAHPVNPRYFTDQSGRLIYLTGSHTWLNVVDGIGPGH